MFEYVDVAECDADSCADGLHDSIRETRLIAARRMALVTRWADIAAPAPGQAGFTPGADGTPQVKLFAATELGCLLQTTTHSAGLLLADALDLRHRHPRCWEAVMTGRLEDYKARHLARATRGVGLSCVQAREVDAEVVAAMTGLPWGRAMNVVEAAIINADPAGHERRRTEADAERYVSLGRRNTTGLGTLIVCSTLADIARLDAMVNQIAEALRLQGDTDELQIRRVKAIVILADPAAACLLLARTTLEPELSPSEPPHPTQPASAGEPTEQRVPVIDAASELGRLLLAQGATALARLRPRTVLYLHISEETLRSRPGVIRADGLGPVALSDLHRLLGRDAVIVKPVIDPAGQTPVDAYEVPRAMRESVALTRPFEVFPWGTLATRSADYDHTVPYRPPDDGGPPGQTRPANLGPLARGHHNAKTFGGFQLHQPSPGVYLWRTPSGYWYQVDARGTTALGRERALPERTRPMVDWSPLELRLAGILAG